MTKILENRHDRATAAATAPITGLAILEPADAGTATAATAAERSTRQETVTATYMGSHHGRWHRRIRHPFGRRASQQHPDTDTDPDPDPHCQPERHGM